VDAAKLNTEGAEDLILETFLSEAPEAQWPRLLIIERPVGRWQIDLVGLLERSGYRLLMKTRNNTLYER
jgi:hypothetical protein